LADEISSRPGRQVVRRSLEGNSGGDGKNAGARPEEGKVVREIEGSGPWVSW